MAPCELFAAARKSLHFVGCEAADWLEWQDCAYSPHALREGLLQIPDVPGVGLTWNEDAVAAHQLDR